MKKIVLKGLLGNHFWHGPCLLQQAISGGEIIWPMETYDKSFFTQDLCSIIKFKMETVTSVFIQKVDIMFPVGLKHAYFQIQFYPELRLSLICHEENDFPVQKTMLWFFSDSPGLHQGVHTGFNMGLSTGNQPSSLPGWFASHCKFSPRLLEHNHLLQFAGT